MRCDKQHIDVNRKLGSVPFGFATTWIKAHAERCVMANKPCFFEECEYPAGGPPCDLDQHQDHHATIKLVQGANETQTASRTTMTTAPP